MNKILNLVHIGFSKTGSSFLKYWYAEHPQLQYTNKETLGGFEDTTSIYDYTKQKELDRIKYFVTSDSRMHCWRILDVDDADNWFDIKDTFEHQKKVSQIVRGLFGEAKILIVTRGFEGVLKSFYSSYVKRGGALDMKGMLGAYCKDYIMPAYNYDTVIRLYIQTFGKENVVVLPYELLSENVELFLCEIEGSFGMDHAEFIPPPVNVSFKPNELYWYRKMSRCVKHLLKPFGRKYSKIVVNRYVHLLSRNKLQFSVKLLQKISGKQESLDVPETFLKGFQGKAEILKEYSRYKDYFID